MRLIYESLINNWHAVAFAAGTLGVIALVMAWLTGVEVGPIRRRLWLGAGIVSLSAAALTPMIARNREMETPKGRENALAELLDARRADKAADAAKGRNALDQLLALCRRKNIRDLSDYMAEISETDPAWDDFLRAQSEMEPIKALNIIVARGGAKKAERLKELTKQLESGEAPPVNDASFYNRLSKEVKATDGEMPFHLHMLAARAAEQPETAAVAEELAPQIEQPAARSRVLRLIATAYRKAGKADRANAAIQEAARAADAIPKDDYSARFDRAREILLDQKKSGGKEGVDTAKAIIAEASCLPRPVSTELSWLPRLVQEVRTWRALGEAEKANRLLRDAWAKLAALPPSPLRDEIAAQWRKTLQADPEERLSIDGGSELPGVLPTKEAKRSG